VIPKICNSCAQQSTVKLCSLYWAWTRADRRRVAYLQKLCLDCFRLQVADIASRAQEPVLMCPACGIDTVDDHDDVFVTICVPGFDKLASEWPLCGPCAVEVRNRAILGASRLEDRQSGSLGADASPQPVSSADAWAGLGIVPR